MSSALAGMGRLAVGAVGELIGDEEAALAADVHAVEAGVPAGDDLVLAVGEGEGLAAVDGGVELGAVGEVAGVVDGVELVRRGELAGADFGVDVVEGEAGGLKPEGLAEFGTFERRDVIELDAGLDGDGVEGLGAGQAGGSAGILGESSGSLEQGMSAVAVWVAAAAA